MVQKIRKVAKEALEESKGYESRGTELWWWNKSAQSKVRFKRKC